MSLTNTNTAVICIGSNTADREARVKQAIAAFATLGSIMRQSSIYDNAADNGIDPPYLNTVILLATVLSHAELCAKCCHIEAAAGRTPESKARGAVPLDADVVIFNNAVMRPRDNARPYFTMGYKQIVTER